MSAQNASHQRFDELYRSLGAPILAYAARRTASPQDAADVTADTFAVVWRRIDDLPLGDDARPWLYGIARRVLANHHRGARRQVRLSERVAGQMAGAVDDSLAVDPSETTLRASHRPDSAEPWTDPTLHAALESLDETDRELLTLLAWDELSRSEIAQILECSTSALRVRLHRARRRLRSALEALDNTPTPLHDDLPDNGCVLPAGSKEL